MSSLGSLAESVQTAQLPPNNDGRSSRNSNSDGSKTTTMMITAAIPKATATAMTKRRKDKWQQGKHQRLRRLPQTLNPSPSGSPSTPTAITHPTKPTSPIRSSSEGQLATLQAGSPPNQAECDPMHHDLAVFHSSPCSFRFLADPSCLRDCHSRLLPHGSSTPPSMQPRPAASHSLCDMRPASLC